VKTDVSNSITDELQSWVGRSVGPIQLPEAITSADVRRYLDATGDTNPLWTDEAVAHGAGYSACPVPPMLVMEMYRRAEGSGGAGDANLWEGMPLPPNYTDTRNAGNEIEWLAPVSVGDRLDVRHELKEISAHQGRAGLGIYITRESEFRKQDGAVVVRLRATTVKLPAADTSGSERGERRSHGADH